MSARAAGGVVQASVAMIKPPAETALGRYGSNRYGPDGSNLGECGVVTIWSMTDLPGRACRLSDDARARRDRHSLSRQPAARRRHFRALGHVTASLPAASAAAGFAVGVDKVIYGISVEPTISPPHQVWPSNSLLEDWLTDVPKRIQDRVSGLLAEDGFSRPLIGIYVRKWHENWCAWIALSGTPYFLSPRVGVYNQDYVRIHNQAMERVGRIYPGSEGADAPLIMALLERLIADDPDCNQRLSWRTGRNNPLRGFPTSVADDIVYYLRKKAYPFFDEHVSLESIVAAARAGMPSHAMEYYSPKIMLKMGKREELQPYVQGWTKRFPPDIAKRLERYVDAVIEIIDLEIKH
ncbi:MAG TPA: hypothetical protein VL462_00475 [Candidatus Nitrosotalea sp.]|nr:hypothetical protein [Candidatus Nitrosotalea sp.]